MSSPMMNPLDRRHFLRSGLGLCAGLSLAPAALAGFSKDARTRRLVLVQLSGGNDGLSTIVPYADDAYYDARRATAIKAKSVLPLDDYCGFHPELTRFDELFKDGRLAVVQGAGYPDPVRSHFRSLEVWHTGRRAGRASGDGWVARLSREAFARETDPELVVHIGKQAPYSLHSSTHPSVALESPTAYRWFGGEGERNVYERAGMENAPEQPVEAESGRDNALAKLRAVLDDARASSARIRRAALRYRSRADYPRDSFGAQLHDIAALIHGNLATRVFSVALSGFDTHAGQKASHDKLMSTLDAGLGALMDDLARSDAGRDTLVVVFSEFGRRVNENGSAGTDHGKAGPMFVFGHELRGGLYGEHPSLTELDAGDLRYTTDFRSVYAAVVEDWFGASQVAVLGESFQALPLLRA